MNPSLDKLQPYPFQKLATLKAGVTPPEELNHIPLSIGEPKHKTPVFIRDALHDNLHGVATYSATKGTPELRQAITDWLIKRYDLPPESLDIERHVLPVNGTREALFAFAQAAVDASRQPQVLMPNPFYQIYEGAALLAGAEPVFLSCTDENNFLPDFDGISPGTWKRCQLLYLCSPGNPTGAVADMATLQRLINLAEEHDFIIASDECYSEIYLDEENPPPGLLQAAAEMGNTEYRRCIVFNSLSKRSSVPGLRSGFVAGDADLINPFFLYRTYHGCAMPTHHQAASIKAWSDEQHAEENRSLYRKKLEAAHDILYDVLPVERAAAGFYLWPETPVSDTEFARGLFAQQNVTVLPGSFLSREVDGMNPGSHRVRMALVAPLDECVEAAERIKTFIKSL
ncbi:succinyldiaminopimelate transaminase [Solemya velesiana gill symbiont]|uniref:Succinyldiaminopimelate transaminase n=1 Tax=Solemya velesiana gill symbiont TaxID=1918948 RepID=A0A1T2KWD4_9GAMM|nr:succinyldiaminopimelate transaminase [Solemya velesiana gill symbiont]OOZ37111.1 succinyldiaminopimelate transaminase [Solemya velesiana gill symbiont]